jgi:LAO/AO transport system kinase
MISHHGVIMQALPGPAEPSAVEEIDGWVVPVLKTNALSGEGVAEVLAQVEIHRQHLRDSGEMERREMARIVTEFEAALRDRLLADLLDRFPVSALEELLDRISRRELAPREAVTEMLAMYSPTT